MEWDIEDIASQYSSDTHHLENAIEEALELIIPEEGPHLVTDPTLRQIITIFRDALAFVGAEDKMWLFEDVYGDDETKDEKTAPELSPERRRTSAPGSGEDGAESTAHAALG